MPAFSLGLFLACLALVWISGLSAMWWLAILFVVLLLLLLLSDVRQRGLFLGGLFLGSVVTVLHIVYFLPLQGGDFPEESLAVGSIEGLVAHDRGGVRFDFLLEGDDTPPRSIRVRWSHPPMPPSSGERWLLPLRFEQTQRPRLDGEFDRARWRFRHGIANIARVDPRGTAIRLEGSGGGLHRFRERLSLALDDSLDGSEAAALIRGVTVGDRSGFSPGQWAVLNATGTTHLVAISGLHIGLVGGLIFALLRTPARYLPGHWPAVLLAGGAALAGAALYAALAGFALPTRRALIMFACLVFLLALRRRTSVTAGLATAGALVLLLDPLAVMDAGFYLSFALVGLVLMVVSAGDRPAPVNTFVRVQWVTGLAVLPLLLIFFAQGPLSSPLANALAVPVFSFLVVPVSLIAALMLSVGWADLAQWPLAAAEAVLDWLWPLLEVLAEGPTLAANQTHPGILSLGLLAALGLVLPGPLWSRLALTLALLPVLVGVQGPPRTTIEHWSLTSANQHPGAIRRVTLPQGTLIHVSGDARSIDYSVRRWLWQQGGAGDSILVLEAGEGLGPGRLDGLMEAWGEGRVFLADAGRVSPGNARFCSAGEVGPFRLHRDRHATASRCRVSWAQQGQRWWLDSTGLYWSPGNGIDCQAILDWPMRLRMEVGREGRLKARSARRYWWRWSGAAISGHEANTVSCSGIEGVARIRAAVKE